MTQEKKASNPMPTETATALTETPAEFDYRDSINVARGVLFGFLCAAAIWLGAGVLIFAVTR